HCSYLPNLQLGQKSFAPSPQYITLSYPFSFLTRSSSLPLQIFTVQVFAPVKSSMVSHPCPPSHLSSLLQNRLILNRPSESTLAGLEMISQNMLSIPLARKIFEILNVLASLMI